MNKNLADYYAGRIRGSFESCQWNDSAAQDFESKYLSRITKALSALGDACDSTNALIRESESLLH